MPERTLATSHGAFRAVVDGPEGGPRALLIHGLGTSLHIWDDAIPELAARGVQVAAVDVLGHGHSQKPQHLFTIEQHAASMIDVLDALGWERPVLVGNSMGALIALAAAARFPDRVAGVVAIGCPAWGSGAERQQWLISRSSLIDLATGQPKPSSPSGQSAAAAAVFADRAGIGLWLLNSVWATGTYDLMADLKAVRAPVHVIYGESDWLESTGRNLECLATVTFATMPDAGHHTPLDQGAATGRDVATFINDVVYTTKTPSYA
ncbi:MAG: alpha/beta fold hydrolase [Dehalococcoidia bacterium]